MRRYWVVFGVVLFALALGVRVLAATVTITATRADANGAVATIAPVTNAQGAIQPPVAQLGQYIVASGQGFPANQQVLAFLVLQGQVTQLSYQDLRTSVTAAQQIPMTDSAGSFKDFAFTLPAPGTITSGTAEIQISAGSVSVPTPVVIDAAISTSAGRGDKIAVGIGAAFALFGLIVIVRLTRGLPTYPARLAAARSAGGADAA